MKSVLLALIDEIRSDKLQYGRVLAPPASAKELQTLQAAAHQQLNYTLPTAYLEVLATCDGIDWNGFQLYATREIMNTGLNGRLSYERMGLVESNLIWREFPPNSEFVFLAESGEMLYSHHLTSNKFEIVDRLTNEMDDEDRDSFTTCEEMLERLFKKMLNGYNE